MKEKQTLLSPIIIRITNTSDTNKMVKIFGWNNYFALKNYGNHKSIKIETIDNTELPYKKLFNRSLLAPFTIGVVRLEFEDWNFYNGCAAKLITFTNYQHKPITWSIKFKTSEFQQYRNAIDTIVNAQIDANSEIKIKVKANSELIISMFISTQAI